MKLRLARLASTVGRFLDRFRSAQAAQVVTAYLGYATPDALVVRGRVLSNVTQNIATATQSKWTNLRQMVRLFMTHEVANVPVTAMGQTTTTDEEGYFTLHLPLGDFEGRVDVTVQADEATAECPVIIPAKGLTQKICAMSTPCAQQVPQFLSGRTTQRRLPSCAPHPEA